MLRLAAGGAACCGALVLAAFRCRAPLRSVASPRAFGTRLLPSSRPYTRLRCVAFNQKPQKTAKATKKVANPANKSRYLFAYLFFFYICSMLYKIRNTYYKHTRYVLPNTYYEIQTNRFSSLLGSHFTLNCKAPWLTEVIKKE
jgi:hypothetical protein